MSDREALVTDPQQRMLLELVWEAFEDAGIPASQLRGSKTGVFVGVSMNEYLSKVMHFAKDGSAYASIGNASAAVANRLSYAYDLQGPSLALDTACSSALVALHHACQSLRSREANLAITAASNLQVNPLTTINLTKSGVCSPDGRVHAFDADANGFVRADGAGVVILKRLADAVADQDPIYATIVGSAINHNGGANGLSAPRRETQEAVMRAACANGQIEPRDVSYVEAHATGTPIGDAIELAALQNVYGRERTNDEPLRIGSVKTNVGHCEAASGMAGLCKVLLAMQHQQLPATLHFKQAHRDSILASSAMRVVKQIEPWHTAQNTTVQPDYATAEAGQAKLVAGISAFGFGGANAHVLLQQYCQSNIQRELDMRDQPLVLVVSARTELALRENAQRMAEFLKTTEASWYDICWSAAFKREHLDCRLAVVAGSAAVAAECLEAYLKGATCEHVHVGRIGRLSSLKQHTDTPSLNETSSSIAEQVAGAFLRGEPVAWMSLLPQTGSFVRLPHYAWQRQRFWIDLPSDAYATSAFQMEPQNARTGQTPTALKPRPDLNVELVEPADALERWLAGQWCEALRLEQVGVEDNFFELGGDSLQAAGLLNRLQHHCGEVIPVMALFDAQTVASLARFLRQKHPAGVERLLAASQEPSSRIADTTSSVLNGIMPARPVASRLESRAKRAVEKLDDAAVEELLRRKLAAQTASRESDG